MALKEELEHQGRFLFKYRGYLPVLFLAAGFGVKIYQDYTQSNPDTLIANILISSAIFVGLFGLLIRCITVGYTPKNTSGRKTDKMVADTLNTTGFYAIVRNPLYLGNYLMWISIGMLTGSLNFVVLFSLIFWIYYERIIYSEEAFLRGKFGDVFLNWAAKTPIFLPTKWSYKKPIQRFNWRRVLEKERNGLMLLFVLFYAIKSIEVYIKTKTLLFDGWEFFCAIGAIIIFVILKFLEKKTNYLIKLDV